MLPEKLKIKLQSRNDNNSLRELTRPSANVDFSSNDYLGFSNSSEIYNEALSILNDRQLKVNGSGGSRLLTGNHALYQELEEILCDFHKSEAALVFNSGFDANIGLLSSVPQRGDLILFDELVHASIREGIRLSHARAIKFAHNDLEKLQNLIKDGKNDCDSIYVISETVFSMDGDSPNLLELVEICSKTGCHLILDEAHAIGVCGKGRGLVCELNLESRVFARIITFGKAIGVHGAAILGGDELISFLINFARSFIYTTAIPPHTVATIIAAYSLLKNLSKNEESDTELMNLNHNIAILHENTINKEIQKYFIKSNSAIHSCIISGNDRVKHVSNQLANEGFDVRPILSPTVAEGKERLRICLHSFNTEKEIETMISSIAKSLT